MVEDVKFVWLGSANVDLILEMNSEKTSFIWYAHRQQQQQQQQ